eukprot:9149318-Alexandrium_andersonii.AAC.1
MINEGRAALLIGLGRRNALVALPCGSFRSEEGPEDNNGMPSKQLLLQTQSFNSSNASPRVPLTG